MKDNIIESSEGKITEKIKNVTKMIILVSWFLKGPRVLHSLSSKILSPVVIIQIVGNEKLEYPKITDYVALNLTTIQLDKWQVNQFYLVSILYFVNFEKIKWGGGVKKKKKRILIRILTKSFSWKPTEGTKYFAVAILLILIFFYFIILFKLESNSF